MPVGVVRMFPSSMLVASLQFLLDLRCPFLYGAIAYLGFSGYSLIAFLYPSWHSHDGHDSLVLLAMGRRWQGYELRAGHLCNGHLGYGHRSPGCGLRRSFLVALLAMALPAKEHGQCSCDHEQTSPKMREESHRDTECGHDSNTTCYAIHLLEKDNIVHDKGYDNHGQSHDSHTHEP